MLRGVKLTVSREDFQVVSKSFLSDALRIRLILIPLFTIIDALFRRR